MTSRQKHIEVAISTPYHTMGELSDKTEFTWFACHGQGQLAEYFIKKWEGFDPKKHFVIAPQGLSKYYLNGFTGRVGASWMTKEDRLTEINNQQILLKSIWEHEIGDLMGPKVIFFGFSQGGATISRFAAHSKIPFDKLVIWAGGFAPELILEDFSHLKGHETMDYFTSREDPYFEEPMIENQQKLVKAAMGIEPKLTIYEGGHRIIPELLPSLC